MIDINTYSKETEKERMKRAGVKKMLEFDTKCGRARISARDL